MTVTLTKVQTQVTWRSPDPGDKTVSIPGSAPENKGYDLDITTTLGDGSSYIITPVSGTIDGQPDFTFTDEFCTLFLRSDADNNDWIIRCLCCRPPPDAVFFDGFEGSYYTTALSGVSNGPLLSFSFWIKADQNFQSFIPFVATDYSGNFPGGFYWRQGDGDLQIFMSVVPSGATGVNARMVVPVDGKFHNILGAVDATTSSSVGVFYVDETLQENFFILPGPLQLQTGAGGFAIPDFPAGGAGSQIHVGVRGRDCLGDFWWAPGQFIDFSQSTNRAKFHDISTLAPVAVSSLGTSGEIPTGTAPAAFMIGGKSTFGNNLGSGGTLIATDVVENCLEGLHVSLPGPSTTKGGIRFAGADLQLTYFVGVNYTSVTLQFDSPTGLLSVWVRIDALPASGQFIALFSAMNGFKRIINIYYDSNGRMHAIFTAFNGVTTATFAQTTGGLPADGIYHHLMFGWNTQTGTAQAIVDRNVETVTHSGSAGFDVGISMTVGHGSALNTAWASLSSQSTVAAVGQSLTGDAAELWVSLYETLDLSVSANIDKFEVDGHPANLGADGSTPTGTAPFAYHSQQPQTYEAITFNFDRAIPPGVDSTQHGVTGGFNNTTGFPTIAPAPYP